MWGWIQMLCVRSSEKVVILEEQVQVPIMCSSRKTLHRPKGAEAKITDKAGRTCFSTIIATVRLCPLVRAKCSQSGPHHRAEEYLTHRFTGISQLPKHLITTQVNEKISQGPRPVHQPHNQNGLPICPAFHLETIQRPTTQKQNSPNSTLQPSWAFS